MNDHAERLTNEARERKWPNVRPKDAATLIIIDRSHAEPKVLMGRRHPGHKFMPGKFVFPGGRIDPEDRRIPFAAPLDPVVEGKLRARPGRPNASIARSLALAAIRETFEETGLMIGARASAAATAGAGAVWTDFLGRGLVPALDGLRFIARAITPPRRPKRFDTRFLAIDASAIAERVDGVTGPDSELIELCWVSLDEARSLDLPGITHVVLDELKARTDAGFGADLPVPYYYEVRRSWRREVL